MDRSPIDWCRPSGCVRSTEAHRFFYKKNRLTLFLFAEPFLFSNLPSVCWLCLVSQKQKQKRKKQLIVCVCLVCSSVFTPHCRLRQDLVVQFFFIILRVHHLECNCLLHQSSRKIIPLIVLSFNSLSSNDHSISIIHVDFLSLIFSTCVSTAEHCWCGFTLVA